MEPWCAGGWCYDQEDSCHHAWGCKGWSEAGVVASWQDSEILIIVGTVLAAVVCGCCGLHGEYGHILNTGLVTCAPSDCSLDLATCTMIGFLEV